MNSPHQNLLRLPLALAAFAVVRAPAGAQSTQPPASTSGVVITDANFPHIIPVETWQAQGGFRRGDSITIRLVRGDRRRIEPGGTYVVLGTYTLRSAPEATLALSLTSSANGGRSTWADSQRRKIEAGDGSFSLVATMHAAGEFHVSYYIPDPANPRRSSSQGGIYFDNR